MSSCGRKFLPVAGKFLLWQQIYSCGRIFFPVTGKSSMRQEISSCGTKFLTKNFFPGQDISGIFHPSDIKLQQKCMIFGYISKSWQKCVILVISKNSNKSAWFLFKTSPEGSRLPAKILGILAAKIQPWREQWFFSSLQSGKIWIINTILYTRQISHLYLYIYCVFVHHLSCLHKPIIEQLI